MKSIYSYLLLVVLTNYLHGMEEKLAYCTTQHLVPVYLNTNPTSTTSSHSVELMPVFKRTTNNVSHQHAQRAQEKPLLSTKTSTKIARPDKKTMINLHAKVYDFISNICLDYNRQSKLDSLRLSLKYDTPFDELRSDYIGYYLANIIREMQRAKENGLTEDIMGRYSYETTEYIMPVKASNNYISLFFSLLKKYSQYKLATKESLPFAENASYFVSTVSPDNIYQTYKDNSVSIMSNTYANQYPAFYQLVEDVHYVLQEPREQIIQSMVSYFYESEHAPEKNTSPKSIPHLQFYLHGCEIFKLNRSCVEILELLKMIEATRTSTSACYEDELAQKMRTFEPSLLDKGTNSIFWHNHILNQMSKDSIATLFTLIKEYNAQKHYKITPSLKQYLAYTLKGKLMLLFPDTYNAYAFDHETYALPEFCHLIGKIDLLKQSFNIAQQENM